MHARTRTTGTSHNKFMRAVQDELTKFERSEREFRKKNRDERAKQLFQLTPPFLQAARKNATLRATWASISGSSVLRFTSNQRPKQHGHSDEVKEESRRHGEALRGEGRQRPKLVGLRQLAQQVDPKFSAEITRPPADGAGQIGKAVRFRDSQPHQPDSVAVEAPVD
jgi:hypothetical protein